MKRRTLIKYLAAGALLLGTGGIARYFDFFSTHARGSIGQSASAVPLDVHFPRQIVTENNSRSRTLMWQTMAPDTDMHVELREKSNLETSKIIPSISTPFTDDGEDTYLHTVKLTHLTKGTAYEWRVVQKDAATPWYDMTTPADDESYTALLFPDTQSADYTGWQALAQTAYAEHPEASLALFIGDLVDNGEVRHQWNEWFHAVAPFAPHIPLAPAMGNHETYNRDWKVRRPESYLAQFAVPEVADSLFPRYYYAFDFGPVHYAVLNTQWKEVDDFQSGLLEEQLAWLPKDMAASNAKWKVVLLHKDVLQYRITDIERFPDRKEGVSEVGEVWMPLFDELGVDLVLTGHLHTYRRRGHIQGFQRDEKGPLYILTGVAGDVRYPNLWVDHSLDEFVAPQPETNNFMTLQVSPTTLTVSSYLPDGSLLDQVSLTK